MPWGWWVVNAIGTDATSFQDESRVSFATRSAIVDRVSAGSPWQQSSHGLRDTEKRATETPRHRESLILGFFCGSVALWPIAPCLAGRVGLSPRPAEAAGHATAATVITHGRM